MSRKLRKLQQTAVPPVQQSPEATSPADDLVTTRPQDFPAGNTDDLANRPGLLQQENPAKDKWF
jgi:hypothetical protein